MSQSSPHNVINLSMGRSRRFESFASGGPNRLEGMPLQSASSAFDRAALHARPVNGTWKRWVEDASLIWDKLTDEDLAELESRRKTLAVLVRSRYRLSSEEIDRQVTGFIKDHQAYAL